MAETNEGPTGRPKRVIILDADDPMVEIDGRIVWQEEHDQALVQAREKAFSDGYEAGQRDASASPAKSRPERIVVHASRRLSPSSILIPVLLIAAMAGLLIAALRV